jgi:hypothetical protein
MTWTENQQIDYFLRLPWTVVAETTPEGDRVLRIAEIPGATGSGRTPIEMEEDLWESLRESLRAYLHFGDPVPLPSSAKAPWIAAAHNPHAPTPLVVRAPRVGATAGSHELHDVSTVAA